MTTPDHVDASTIEVRPEHAAMLTSADTLTSRIRYACEHLSPPVTVHAARQWLAAYGYPTSDKQRPYVSKIVNTWRAERGMGDTADQLPLTAERLAELDEIADRAGQLDPEPIAADPTPAPAPAPEPVELPEPVETQGPVAETESPAIVTTTPAPALAPGTPADARPRGAGLFYVVAVAATGVSVDTSWRFFGERLHITNLWERGAMFGVVELALIACGWAMRANVRRPDGTPGAARMLAWALCGLAGYMALDLAGPVEGLARVMLGPVLALVTLHLALGIEVRVRRGQSAGMGARVFRELRERLLSRLGLADDSRTALARTRDRATDRAARLATARWTIARRARMARAVRTSGAALDPAQRARLVTQVAALRHLDDLSNSTVERPSPWL